MKVYICLGGVFICGLLSACSQQDPALLNQKAVQQERIQRLEKELSNLVNQPTPNLEPIKERIALHRKAVDTAEQQVAELQPQIEEAKARLAEVENIATGNDKITFSSGLEVVGRVKAYQNARLTIVDGMGNEKKGSPTAVKDISFRMGDLAATSFPTTSRPKPKPALTRPTRPVTTSTATEGVPTRLEVKMIKRFVTEREYRYSSYRKQEVSFTARITNRDPLNDGKNLQLKIWIISRDISDKSEYKVSIKENEKINIARGQTVNFDTSKVDLSYYDSSYNSSWDSGYKYYGYALEISSEGGKQISFEASSSTLKKNFQAFYKLGKDDEFTL